MRGLLHEIGFWTWIAIVAGCFALIGLITLVIWCCKSTFSGAVTTGATILSFSGGTQKVDLVKALDEIDEMKES